ncbi:molybdenum cofactor guanylyltransferase [Kribbella sp. CA-293567]|uniref:molybdenum cofactor guanylyltransferase n=1 Tax=Kribbella sp. CA-293567 TaxID=3002436 RepID=UPI0022DD5DDA|nr:NTP transferase domain-containing protein [Kribbella sp. CA-293567]WBQ05265.1 NTP transferase domain-containing protein [Kribbella sp. CA-293567]
MEFDAVVLAGGGSTRFGGVDKALLVLDGTSLLDRVLKATILARSTVVVGPERAVCREVGWTREEPAGGGPVAGIAAGLAVGQAPVVVLLSCDLPWITAQEVGGLVESIGELDGFGLLDTGGREQWLAAAYRRTALVAALERVGDPQNQSVRRLFRGLELGWSAPSRAGDDVDSWADLDD